MDYLMTEILEVNDKERPSRVIQKSGRHVSILPFVNTKGEAWLVAYLLSGEASTDEGGQETVNVPCLPLQWATPSLILFLESTYRHLVVPSIVQLGTPSSSIFSR